MRNMPHRNWLAYAGQAILCSCVIASSLAISMGAFALGAGFLGTAACAEEKTPSSTESAKPKATLCAPALPKDYRERKLFNGKSLAGWTVTKFGGEGPVAVKDGVLDLGFGSFMTGVTYAGKDKLPTTNYEILLEAQRTEGTDFFCGLTVPFRESHFSLIVGGWGGGVTGISSIDRLDASENDTTRYTAYKNNVWYCIRLRVTDKKITAWIDNKESFSFPVDRETFSTRIEVELSKPLGICAFDTHAQLRNIRIRSWDVADNPPLADGKNQAEDASGPESDQE